MPSRWRHIQPYQAMLVLCCNSLIWSFVVIFNKISPEQSKCTFCTYSHTFCMYRQLILTHIYVSERYKEREGGERERNLKNRKAHRKLLNQLILKFTARCRNSQQGNLITTCFLHCNKNRSPSCIHLHINESHILHHGSSVMMGFTPSVSVGIQTKGHIYQ